jgi:hypothetical protein
LQESVGIDKTKQKDDQKTVDTSAPKKVLAILK